MKNYFHLRLVNMIEFVASGFFNLLSCYGVVCSKHMNLMCCCDPRDSFPLVLYWLPMLSYNAYIDLCDDLVGGLVEILMDKSWIHMHRTSLEYRNGVESFLEFAFCNAGGSKLIVCPCNKCKVGHNHCLTKEEVAHHLMFNGF